MCVDDAGPQGRERDCRPGGLEPLHPRGSLPSATRGCPSSFLVLLTRVDGDFRALKTPHTCPHSGRPAPLGSQCLGALGQTSCCLLAGTGVPPTLSPAVTGSSFGQTNIRPVYT